MQWNQQWASEAVSIKPYICGVMAQIQRRMERFIAEY